MNCLLKSGLCIALGIIAGSAAKAQTMGLCLSLEDAQQYALQHNQTIANASLDVRKSEAQKWKSIASMLPQITANTDVSNMFGYEMDFGTQKVSLPSYASYGFTASMALSGGQIASVGVQKLAVKMSDISLKKSELEICDQTKTLYCSALVGEASLELLKDSYDSMQELYQMTLKSVETGVSEQTDADQLLVQVKTLEDNIASAKRSVEVVYNSMRLLLNIEAGTTINLTDNIDHILNLAAVDAVMGEEFDINRNYSYQLLKENTKLAKKQIGLTGWSNGPTLAVAYQYTGKTYLEETAMKMNMTPPNLLSVSLKIPIFTSLSATKAVQNAKLAYQQQLNTLQQTEYSLKIQHAQLVYNLRTALEKYKTQEESVDVAKRVFDNIASKYKYGVSSSMDVTNANNSLITAKSNYIQAVLDIMEAQISLEELLNRK